MSSCLSGGGRATYTIDLDIIKSPSTSLRTSHSSSPSSTISESSNSPIAISTRKSRTPRKRPNQTYNEAAVLLSTAYPNIFPAKDICKKTPSKFSKPHEYSSFSFEEDSSELLLPFPVEKPAFQIDSMVCEKPLLNDSDENEIGSQTKKSNLTDEFDDFDAESILDEENEEGVIDNILGDLSVRGEEESSTCSNNGIGPNNFCYGYPVGLGLGFDFGFGLMRKGVAKAFRQSNEGDWWRFNAVNVGEISPRFYMPLPAEKKKKVENLNPKLKLKPPSYTTLKKDNSTSNSRSNSISSKEDSSLSKLSPGVLLKLNYDEVLNEWSDRGSPFSDEIFGSELSGSDALVCLF